MKLIDAMRTDDSLTANGAVTNSTSLHFCLDMFFMAGASRSLSEEEIILIFERAFGANPLLAIRILFWSRDTRGGAGEKRFFQILITHIQKTYPKTFTEVYPYIPEYGYFKDFFKLKPTRELLNYFAWALSHHKDANLLAKYFPRKGKWFNAFRIHQHITPKELRKSLVNQTKVVETKLCSKKWDEINYSKVPSVAMRNYGKIFGKHDHDRFANYLVKVKEGKTKINSSALFPHELYLDYLKSSDSERIQAQWNALPNFLGNSDKHRILPVCDVSGSMTEHGGLPMLVSVALGVYISERNKGVYKDSFVTFSDKPSVQVLQGDVFQRFRQLSKADWEQNTNLTAVFELILESALKNNLTNDDLPTCLLIISDMDFDECGKMTALDMIRDKYQVSGYTLPSVVFWNVRSRLGNVPAKRNSKGVMLVSGYSPSILSYVLDGSLSNPEEMMMRIVNSPRYSDILI